MGKRRYRKPDKQMEYEQAPSGYVTLYNYKEPFMRFEEGFGLQGVLLFDGKTDKVQCHLCGDWFDYLPYHLRREHSTTALQYKEKVGLSKNAALISETWRNKLIARGLEARLKNLKKFTRKRTPTERRKISKGVIESNNRMGFKNIQGTCPDQLIQRLQALAKKLGRTPSNREVTFEETLLKTFGTRAEYLRRAGLKPNPTGKRLTPLDQIDKSNFYVSMRKRRIWTKERILESIKDFNHIHGRPPTYSDRKRKLILININAIRREFGSFREACKEAGYPYPEHRKKEHRIKTQKIILSKDEVVQNLLKFYLKYKRHPFIHELQMKSVKHLCASATPYMIQKYFGTYDEAKRVVEKATSA